MRKLNKLDTAFWSRIVFSFAALLAVFAVTGHLTAVHAQYANLAGSWESDYSGSWRPASIRQSGAVLWFTNENNDTTEGRFESPSRVSASLWKIGATIQDKDRNTTIKWDNGTTWRRAGSTVKKFVWERVGTGDCTRHDVGNSEGSTPDDSQAREGYTAVCWDGGAYKNGGRVFCTYKRLPPDQCTQGSNTGVMYRAVPQSGTPSPPTPTPPPTGEPKCDGINGSWYWNAQSGYNFIINPSNFPFNSNRIWATLSREVSPGDPTHGDRWGEYECIAANRFKLVNRMNQTYLTLTLRNGRLYHDDGRFACINNAECQ